LTAPTTLDPRIASGADYGNPDPVPAWMEVDWREHRRSVELPGARVNYVEIGEGDPILFIHGISGGWQNWLENLPHFAATHRAIALDLPGFGTSPMPEWEVGMAAYARMIHDFCERLGLQRPVLVGNSMGGFVAVQAATQEPRRYSRLVLVSAAGIINTWNPEARATATAYAWSKLGGTVADKGHWIVSHPRSRQLALAPFLRYPGRLRRELLLEQMAGGRCPGFGDALRDLIGHDVRERLATIEMPTLIVWGLSDRVIPVSAAISYHRRIPHSRLEIFERTGHVPQLERPARFNALLDEFLADTGAPIS
jgi:pimeloyl-ACP methyl ester carboxylesterase